MLKVSYTGCPGLSLAILVQFVLEMCVATQNHKKTIKNPILMFKVIQGHCSWWQSKARVRLPISD